MVKRKPKLEQSILIGVLDAMSRPLMPKYNEEVKPFNTGNPYVNMFFQGFCSPGRSLEEEYNQAKIKKLEMEIDNLNNSHRIIDVQGETIS